MGPLETDEESETVEPRGPAQSHPPTEPEPAPGSAEPRAAPGSFLPISHLLPPPAS